MNKSVKYIAIVFAVIIVILLAILAFVNPPKKITVATGPVPTILNYAISPDGHVEIFNPTLNQEIISPATASGSVSGGGWLFEGTFPIKVVDADGTVLGMGQVRETNPGTWTSMGEVPFSGIISFLAPHSATGTVVFSKDNPSGLPQNNESFSVPVRFKQ
jgi:hypothetical protein